MEVGDWLDASSRDNAGKVVQFLRWYEPSTADIGNTAARDRLTGLMLDEQGRYSARVMVGDNVYQPKYLPCADVQCLRTGANLDMSDAGTQAYVQALDQQVFKDIGTGATVGTLATPVGVGARVLFLLGVGGSAGQIALSDRPTEAAFDEAMKMASEKGGEVFLQEVLGHTPSAAARAAALINLSGGWDAFVNRAKVELFGMRSDDSKK